MTAVRADVHRCQGYANCVDAAPDLFDIDDEGFVVVLKESVDGSERAAGEEAVRGCPTAALTLED